MEDEFDILRDLALPSIKKFEKQSKPHETWVPKVNERFCFVITKNKSNSWADDLYACGHISERTRVYN